MPRFAAGRRYCATATAHGAPDQRSAGLCCRPRIGAAAIARLGVGFTQALAKELGLTNSRVNGILAGIVRGKRMKTVIRVRAEQLGLSYAQTGENLSGQSLGVDGNVETL